LAIGTAVILVALPGIYAKVLHKKREDLIKYTVRSRIGALYLGKNEEETAGQVFALVYLVRRLWFTFLTFALASQPHLTVHLFIMNTLHYMIYIGFGQPYTSLVQWKVEVVNEFLLLTQNYYFLLYSGLVTDRKALDSIGLAHVIHIGVLIFFNFTVITVININSICRKLRLKHLESEQKKAILKFAFERQRALEKRYAEEAKAAAEEAKEEAKAEGEEAKSERRVVQ